MIALIGGIIGVELAPTPVLATLPVTLMVIGVVIASFPAAFLMRHIGRRRGFMIGSLIAAAGGLLAAFAVTQTHFTLFCLAVLIIGMNGAFIQQYRYAATESVDPQHAGRAVAIVLLGGIAAGFLGPELAKLSKDLLPSGEYTGSFVVQAILSILAIGILSLLRDVVPVQASGASVERPLRKIVRQPLYLVALFSGMVAYGIMSFIMTATPLNMHTLHNFSLDETAWVIQSHVIAMFLPSLITGWLLDRIGLGRMMSLGSILLLATVGIGYYSQELVHYWGALVLLGLGWNLLFIGGTVLLTHTYYPAERFKAQAANDFTIFGVQALASLSAGTVLFASSWQGMMLISLPLVLAVLVAVLVMSRRISTPEPLNDSVTSR
jgi:MFS family permease